VTPNSRLYTDFTFGGREGCYSLWSTLFEEDDS